MPPPASNSRWKSAHSWTCSPTRSCAPPARRSARFALESAVDELAEQASPSTRSSCASATNPTEDPVGRPALLLAQPCARPIAPAPRASAGNIAPARKPGHHAAKANGWSASACATAYLPLSAHGRRRRPHHPLQRKATPPNRDRRPRDGAWAPATTHRPRRRRPAGPHRSTRSASATPIPTMPGIVLAGGSQQTAAIGGAVDRRPPARSSPALLKLAGNDSPLSRASACDQVANDGCRPLPNIDDPTQSRNLPPPSSPARGAHRNLRRGRSLKTARRRQHWSLHSYGCDVLPKRASTPSPARCRISRFLGSFDCGTHPQPQDGHQPSSAAASSWRSAWR